MKLSEYEINDLIERLQKGENLPEEYKYKLFPVKQKEYELVYGGKMRKEDILANEDGVFPVPLQVEKIFNGKREHFIVGLCPLGRKKGAPYFGAPYTFQCTSFRVSQSMIPRVSKIKATGIAINIPIRQAIINLRNPLSILVPADTSCAILYLKLLEFI